jgi:hypothetical protein
MTAPARAVLPGRADPRKDPRYQRVVEKLRDDSRKLKQHPPASQKASEPAKAAKAPPGEKAAGARARHVEKLNRAETPKPETTTFLAILQAEIAKAMPKTLGDTERFMKGGSSEQMKGSLKGNVAQQKNAATGDLKRTSSEAPSESGVPAKVVTPIAAEPGTPAPPVDAAGAMPAPKPETEVSLQASKADVQSDLDKEKLSDDRLKKANDPRFTAVLSSRDAVAKQADAGPAQFRAREAGVLGLAAAKATDVARRGVVLLLGVKGDNKTKVLSRQQQQKAKEELELKSFTDFVVATFARAKQAVDKRLELLDTRVNDLFDKGIEYALADMKAFVEDQLLRYKLRRYLTVPWGPALWIKDQFLDLPPEVSRFYEAGRKRFTTTMNAVAANVANLVETELAAAKAEVKRAQIAIAERAAQLSPGVKARGAQLQAEFADKFAELEASIDNKKQQLAEGLAQKYKEAFDKADESLKAIQDDNKSLVTKAKEKIGEVLKALAEFKARLMSILKKSADTLNLILNDPIQFLKNLLAVIKLGFNQFVDHIWDHLKAGFLKWLFGSLTKLGVELPTDLTLPSILKLVLGVLGITYQRMRAKAVKLLGPTAVAVIEKVAEYIGALIAGGPAALWEKVKEDLSNLKEMVIDAIQNWLITTIVKKAVAKVVSLFNPVGAIIQAILLIYDVVTFIIDKAAQILEFVEAVVSSIYNIATGAISSAANWIEKSLANMIPILIGFLAQLLGLGGITEKIKEFIKKVQDRVDKAIDKAIAKVVEVVKKVVGAVKAAFGKKDERTEEQKQKDLDAAIREAEALRAKPGTSEEEVVAGLQPIKRKYKMASLALIVDAKDDLSETVYFEGEINPRKTSSKGKVPVEPGDTKRNAIPFAWVKPPVEDYPPIEILQGNKIVTVEPKKGISVGGIRIGVTFSEARKIGTGEAIKAEKPVTSNSKKDYMNKILNANGYDRDKGKDRPRDTDHVIEKQLGGPDDYSNLWPLNETTNRRSGAKVRGEIARIKEKYKRLRNGIHGKFLRLKQE